MKITAQKPIPECVSNIVEERIMSKGRKTKALVKAKEQAISRVQDIAKGVVAKMSLSELSKRVADQALISEEEALVLIDKYSIEKSIHDLLVDQITEGAIAVKAMDVINKKMEEGDLEAAKVVIGFNRKLRPANVRTVTEMNFNDNRVFLDLDKNAKELLGETIDAEVTEVKKEDE